MTATQIVWLAAHAVFCIVLIAAGKKAKAAFKGWLLCAVMGMAGLLLVTYTAGYTGVTMTINPYTSSTAIVLGLPGVILLLAINLLL